MPLSNQKGEGFEQKIAELVAKEWNCQDRVRLVAGPARVLCPRPERPLLRCGHSGSRGVRHGRVTKPYFRSGYVFVTRKDRGLDIKSLADPRLKKLKIGVNILNSDAENTPPAMALSQYGVVGNLTGYPTFYTDTIRPEDIVTAVAKKEIDVGIVWGPVAGYFAKRSQVPLTLQPLAERDSATDFPFRFNIGMAVRRRDRALRDSLQTVLDRRKPEIQAILKEYAIPTFPIPAAPLPADSGQAANR